MSWNEKTKASLLGFDRVPEGKFVGIQWNSLRLGHRTLHRVVSERGGRRTVTAIPLSETNLDHFGASAIAMSWSGGFTGERVREDPIWLRGHSELED